MKIIARNPYYLIRVDIIKNRLYLNLIGHWNRCLAVCDYLSDIKRAGDALPRGFTVLTDLTEYLTPREEVFSLHIQAQQVFLDQGLVATAEILGPDAIIRMAMDDFSTTLGMPKACFKDRFSAENWLDEQVLQAVSLS